MENPTPRYFDCKIRMTAGPRKYSVGENTRELGEDVAGIRIVKDVLYFYVLDGTTDENRLSRPDKAEDLFSSRLFAVKWADALLDSLDLPLGEILLSNTLDKVQADFKKDFDTLKEKEEVYEQLKQKITDLKQIDVSTTLLLGKLTLDGTLEVLAMHDGFLILQPQPESVPQVPPGRVFIRLTYDPTKDTFDFIPIITPDKVEKNTFEGVSKIFCGTDGISKPIRFWLEHNAAHLPETKTEQTLQYARHKTDDDMCLIELSIKECPLPIDASG